MNGQKEKRNWIQLISFLVIVLLTVETAYLMVQNRQLKVTIVTLANQRLPGTLKQGDQVLGARVRDLDSVMQIISYDGTSLKYLFVIFSTTCPHCQKNLDNWKSLAHRAGGREWRILGVSTDGIEGTTGYVVENNLNFEVVCADTSFSRVYTVDGVPEKILINEKGIVQKVYTGVLNRDELREIQTALDAKVSSSN